MSVVIRRLTAVEADKLFPSRRQQDLSDYTEALEGLSIGESAAVPLNGTTARALKRRFGAAAKQQGKTLKWSTRSNSTDELFFIVRADKSALPKRKRGRPRREEGQHRTNGTPDANGDASDTPEASAIDEAVENASPRATRGRRRATPEPELAAV